MTRKKQTDESRPVEVRSKPDYSRVTNAQLATPGHDVPCDKTDCNRDAVWVMADHSRSRGMYGPDSAATIVPGGRRYVRCEMHLNYGSGE